MKSNRLLAFLLSAVFVMMMTSLAAQAAEVRYPIPCYEGEELAKVREWEKTWGGKSLSSKNPQELEGIKELLPESLYNIMKSPDRFGQWDFTIVPYQEVRPTTGDIALTKQYAGQPRVENENLVNYVSGMPFPEPKTAHEIMYNYDNVNWGDTMGAFQDMFLVDGVRKYDRHFKFESWFLYFATRRDMPPVPEIQPNPKGILRAVHGNYLEPAAYVGTRSLYIKWNDRSQDQGSWSFASATRRIYRSSTAQRMDCVGGGDACYNDELGYNWTISRQNYNYLGRKEVLTTRHQNQEKILKAHTEGDMLFKGLDRERIKAYVIEAKYKDPNYLYSKEHYYIDPEHFWIFYCEKFDRKGQLWRIMDQPMDAVKSKYNGEQVTQPVMPEYVDVQRLHATKVLSKVQLGETGQNYQPGFYEPSALQRFGY